MVKLVENRELILARLRDVPETPGVYMMKDARGKVIYVGMSQNLPDRLRSYFSSPDSLVEYTREMVMHVADFDVVTCSTTREAFLLENSFIKQYNPRYNILLKDDKDYLYLKIPVTPSGQTGNSKPDGKPDPTQFPRPYYTRKIAKDQARYFGPYAEAAALRGTVKTLRTIFPFRTCSDDVFNRGRVCLDFHIKRCAGPCEGRISADAYGELLEQVDLFMSGKSKLVLRQLESAMKGASKRTEYEAAARLRDRIETILLLEEKQSVIRKGGQNEDVVAIARGGRMVIASMLKIREGRVVGVEAHNLDAPAESSDEEILANFIMQYYTTVPKLPKRILVPLQPNNLEMVLSALESERKVRVGIAVPHRGPARALVAQAEASARATLRQRQIIQDYDSSRAESLLSDLQQQLGLTSQPRRIECYDISNTMGTNSVGSMVVFRDGKPDPKHYRHFGIKAVEGSDDFASLQETLKRRFARYADVGSARGDDIPVVDPSGSNGAGAEELKVAEGDPDESFGSIPDLVIIDGGKGQLSAAKEVMKKSGLEDVPVVSLAKQEEEVFIPGRAESVRIAHDSPTLFLLQRIRDEAHRFAITRHRAKRQKAAFASQLDVVTGIGPAKKRALLKAFGSVEGIRQAETDDVAKVPGIGEEMARRLKELL